VDDCLAAIKPDWPVEGVSMTKALDGVTVVEFASHPACAYAAMLMAEQGARAIRIEPPGGDPGRGGPHFAVLNRSKRAIALNFETAEGKEIATRLVSTADVIVNGFTPSQVHARGLTYEQVRAINARAVLLNMPPMGSRGPYAEMDAGDELVSAISGVTAAQGSLSGDPVPLAFPLASYQTGILGALAAVAALCWRDVTGEGQAVEVSMLAGALSLQSGSIVRNPDLISMMAANRRDPMGPAPSYRIYEGSDGRYFMLSCVTPIFWNKLALAIGRPELVSDPRFENAPMGLDAGQRAALLEILTPIMRSRTAREWLEIFRQHDVPASPVLTRQQFMDDPQVKHVGMRRELDDPLLGKTVQMGVPLRLSQTPGEIAGPAPALDPWEPMLEALVRGAERRSKIAPVKPPAQAPSSASGGPLVGTRVLDFTGYIAGGYSTMLLAQMGADVIKVESLAGDGFRFAKFAFQGWNQNKRGVVIDLRQARGREIAYQIAKEADLVMENFRPGNARELGVDYETLRALNPRLVYVSINGFGSSGRDFDHPSFDPVLQARSGVMLAHDGKFWGRPPIHPIVLNLPFCDYGAAALGALASVLALRHQRLTGQGQHCEVTLIHSAIGLQAGEFIFYEGRPNLECGAPQSRGSTALRRVYRCQDGRWIFLGVRTAAQWNDLQKLLNQAVTPFQFTAAALEAPHGELAAQLAREFARDRREVWLQKLLAQDVPAAPVNPPVEVLDQQQIVVNELGVELNHPEFGPIAQTGILLKFSSTPCRISCSAPMLGQHTRQVMSEFGYSGAQIEELRGQKVIAVRD
jgi:crotonobetainyl-CoA:carnitine CoA-transferase CaiB-like acyl-CoA transferase